MNEKFPSWVYITNQEDFSSLPLVLSGVSPAPMQQDFEFRF